MSEKYPRGKPAGWRLFWFMCLSTVLVCSGAASGYLFKIPKPPPPMVTELTMEDLETPPPLGDPDAPQDQPPDPQPTPPPPEEEPTPPPLDKPPEFEVPQTQPTPAPQQTPKQKPKTETKPAPATHWGSKTGVVGGTNKNLNAKGGGKFLADPPPPYPPQALQMHITGDVHVTITVSNGSITNASPASGPSMLSSAAARWVQYHWKPMPGTSGTFTLPVRFVMH